MTMTSKNKQRLHALVVALIVIVGVIVFVAIIISAMASFDNLIEGTGNAGSFAWRVALFIVSAAAIMAWSDDIDDLINGDKKLF